MKARRASPADETLGFLVADAARAFRRAFAPLLLPHGVAAGHVPLLRLIGERGGITLSELAHALHLRGPTVVQAVQEMERLRLVRRRADPADGRKANLFLTARGRHAWDAVVPAVRAINARAAGALSAREAATLKRLLRRVRASVTSD